MTANVTKAGFVKPMLLFAASDLPKGEPWMYELKLDGYRAIAFKTSRRAQLRSRNNKDFSRKYPVVTEALASLPDETVIDGEIVALDEFGRPSFNLLQNYGSSNLPVVYYVFDVLVLSGQDVMSEPLAKRRELLRTNVLPKLKEPIRESLEFKAALCDVINAVRAQGLEGVVAKNLNGSYAPGRRSRAWQKMRINKGQQFVICGYTPGPKTFDALIFGYYENGKLLYAGRTRNGFTPMLRKQLQKQFSALETAECPFANLPKEKSGHWGLGLTAKKRGCFWLRPQLVCQFEYVEWTPDNHLRHSRFVALRSDMKARDVVRQPQT